MTVLTTILHVDVVAAQQKSGATAKAQSVLTGETSKKKTNGAATESQPQLSNESGRLEGDIIVLGLRENVKSARNAKRRAQQIVDVVLAQDIGKLPDKNVPEALARVPGVQIDRNRGEGGEVKIRGLGGVMTTVNGSPTFSTGDRTTYLNDISSDLVAGIEVFKTRTPDQVEGSQTGVINLTLRRPTDFKEGATYAFSARGDYADQVKLVNPYLSALIAYNADTDVGQVGFSVNGTFNDVRYRESVRFNELPVRPGDSRQVILPSTTPANIFLPFRVGVAGTDGWSKRAAFSASTQWKPDDRWTATLEGGYANQKMLWADNSIWIPITYSDSAAPPPRLSNLVMNEDGRLVRSVSLTGLDPIGPGRESWNHETSDYNARFQADYRDERIEFTGWVNWRKSDNDSDNIFHWTRFGRPPQVDVVFNNTVDPKGGPTINFNGIDLTDTNNYLYLDGFNQSRNYWRSAETEMKGDLRLNTLIEAIDYIKVGYRYAKRTYDRKFGARGQGNLRLPIASLPNYKLTEVGPLFPNSEDVTNVNWLMGDRASIRNSWNDIRSRIVGFLPDYDTYYAKYQPFDAFDGSDASHAFYGMLHYNLNLLFPIEGTVGARIVNTLNNLRSIQRTRTPVTVDGRTEIREIDTLVSPRGNFLDVLPSVNAIAHITPKLQLRLAYTYDVGRPPAQQINPRLFLDIQNAAAPSAAGGNPDLGPTTLSKYDASLEWYFGTTGSMSVAAWQWNQNGVVWDRILPEILPNVTVPVQVRRPYNLGSGRHRGIEAQATTFFTFLPGVLKSFGASANGTLNITRQSFPNFDGNQIETVVTGPILNVSKYMFNVVGFFERDGLNVRVAYNWRSRRQWRVDTNNPYNNLFVDPVERLDASINYDISKNFTVAVEASNLTANGERSFWGTYDMPNDVRYFSRNYSLSVRTRF
ncbi:TonB-dependent receptor [Sphingomonas sp. GM_Shp_2]|uniref:TonB-dependent receptor n=1 Tax=Sphingomonas sp. GM_Shp_2 TaxID=2937380 RepID=UPI00226A5E97|nr:TonB-dependent receptor [Sphingomonas sp. GM_Shp_2]